MLPVVRCCDCIYMCISLYILPLALNIIQMSSSDFGFVLHGGAGDIAKTIDASVYYNPLGEIVRKTYEYAREGLQHSDRTAVDVAEYAVKLFEDERTFNAGCGSVYTEKETHEMEASIMDGSTLHSGAVAMVKSIKNPVALARVVMEKTSHLLMVGEGAESLADVHDIEKVSQEYFHSKKRMDQLEMARNTAGVFNDHDLLQPETEGGKDDSTGTVGCVCFYKGHIAAATSTGGLTNKLCGRVGDSPICGVGNYANDATCAVSCTGKGEQFMRYMAAYDVSCRMSYAGKSLTEAVRETVHTVLPPNTGGMIAIDCTGQMEMEFNSSGMIRAWCKGNGEGAMGLWEDTIPLDMEGHSNYSTIAVDNTQ